MILSLLLGLGLSAVFYGILGLRDPDQRREYKKLLGIGQHHKRLPAIRVELCRVCERPWAGVPGSIMHLSGGYAACGTCKGEIQRELDDLVFERAKRVNGSEKPKSVVDLVRQLEAGAMRCSQICREVNHPNFWSCGGSMGGSIAVNNPKMNTMVRANEDY